MQITLLPESRRPLWLVSAVGLLVYAACGSKTPQPKEKLEGSLNELIDLGFDQVRLLKTDNDLSLQFVRKRDFDSTIVLDAGTAAEGTTALNEDYPFVLALALADGEIPVKTRIDLTERSDAGVQRARATRQVLNDPRTAFPEFRIGSIWFDRSVEPNATVTGDFHVTFENGSEFASGRTVFSTFSAKVPAP